MDFHPGKASPLHGCKFNVFNELNPLIEGKWTFDVTLITTLCDRDHRSRSFCCCTVFRVNRNFSVLRNHGQFGIYFMKLQAATEKFVAWWGEMGSKWGVNRTVAEIHALYYLSPNPLNAEDVAAALSFSRSNVSAGLHELENWGLIKRVHFRGDRRQYFEAIKDPWEMFRVILDERKRREIEPTVTTLQACLDELAKSEAQEHSHTEERLRAMLEFFEVMLPLYDELRRMPRRPIQSLAKLTAKVREVLK